jgi:hypothetical protein
MWPTSNNWRKPLESIVSPRVRRKDPLGQNRGLVITVPGVGPVISTYGRYSRHHNPLRRPPGAQRGGGWMRRFTILIVARRELGPSAIGNRSGAPRINRVSVRDRSPCASCPHLKAYSGETEQEQCRCGRLRRLKGVCSYARQVVGVGATVRVICPRRRETARTGGLNIYLAAATR